MGADPGGRIVGAPGKPIRVLHLLLWLTPAGGGIQTYLSALCNALRGSSVEVRVGALMPGGPTREVPQPAHLGDGAASTLGNTIAFCRWLRRAVPECNVVHIHGVMSWSFVAGAAMCAWLGVPYVVTPHGQVTHWIYRTHSGRRKSFLRIVAAPLLRRAAAVVATTPAEAQEIAELVPGARVRVVMPGVDLPQPRAPDAEIADGAVQALFVGGFVEQKGLPVLIRALAVLRDSGVRAHLRLLGAGEPRFETRLRQLVKELSLESTVTFCGYLTGSDKEEALRQADVFVLPSYMENFSFATAEALAHGTPAVVSDAVALAQFIQQYGCGAVVPVDDPAALAQAVAVYADAEQRRDQGQRAYQCAREHFSLQGMGRNLASLYVDVAGQRVP